MQNEWAGKWGWSGQIVFAVGFKMERTALSRGDGFSLQSQPWNIDTMCKDGKSKTIINKIKTEKPRELTDEERVKKQVRETRQRTKRGRESREKVKKQHGDARNRRINHTCDTCCLYVKSGCDVSKRGGFKHNLRPEIKNRRRKWTQGLEGLKCPTPALERKIPFMLYTHVLSPRNIFNGGIAPPQPSIRFTPPPPEPRSQIPWSG